jgi:hypothetical protein
MPVVPWIPAHGSGSTERPIDEQTGDRRCWRGRAGPRGHHAGRGPLIAQEAEGDRSIYEQLDLFGDIFERIRADYVERPTRAS